MNVFPEKLNNIDFSNTEAAIKTLYEYLKYSSERIEFSVNNVFKTAAGAGNISAEVVARIEQLTRDLATVAQLASTASEGATLALRAIADIRPKHGNIPPTTETTGSIGQIYVETTLEDKTNIYTCVKVIEDEPTTYKWILTFSEE